MKRRVEGYVMQLRCRSCAASIPTFIFSGDTDMTTAGLESATCCSLNEVAISYLSYKEAKLPAEAAVSHFANRMSDILRRDFRPVRLKRAEGGFARPGVSFQEFKRTYVAPTLVWVCPLCGGDATEFAEQEPMEFLNSGGTLTLVGDIELHEITA